MIFTLANLTTPRTEDEIFAQKIQQLADLGFSSTSWQVGQPELDLLHVMCAELAQMDQIVATLARWLFFGKFQDGEEAAAADAALGFYNTSIQPATPAVRSVTLSNDVGAGPYSVGIGELQLSDDTGVVFTNQHTAFEIPATKGWSATINVQSAIIGSASNVGALTKFVVPIAGVSLKSQAIVSVAQDLESATSLQKRCLERWGSITESGELLPSGYQYWIKTMVPVITRTVFGYNVLTDGSDPYFTIVCAREGGAATSGDVYSAQGVINALLPPCSKGTAEAAEEEPIVPTGTIRLTPAGNTEATKAAIRASILRTINALAIYTPDTETEATLSYSKLVSLLDENGVAIPGVRSATFSVPGADRTPASFNRIFVVADSSLPNVEFVVG